jgi:hypothetical protein
MLHRRRDFLQNSLFLREISEKSACNRVNLGKRNVNEYDAIRDSF